jgi:hypothetical protein
MTSQLVVVLGGELWSGAQRQKWTLGVGVADRWNLEHAVVDDEVVVVVVGDVLDGGLEDSVWVVVVGVLVVVPTVETSDVPDVEHSTGGVGGRTIDSRAGEPAGLENTAALLGCAAHAALVEVWEVQESVVTAQVLVASRVLELLHGTAVPVELAVLSVDSVSEVGEVVVEDTGGDVGTENGESRVLGEVGLPLVGPHWSSALSDSKRYEAHGEDGDLDHDWVGEWFMVE